MTSDRAIQIAEERGAFRPGFYGDVQMTIRDGAVKQVAVNQTFREEAA